MRSSVHRAALEGKVEIWLPLLYEEKEKIRQILILMKRI